ncbi:Tetracenomycin C synthesis protein homolog [Hyella patelloides LEGE 07179]|uniref:Tetracenomycin C synthesis protein homolog n=1 Tax=Hyella patelloides LEGE 07179 TaxID=945734 RepID=A0A563W1G0_9CYAN|nr:class I SAM-dependent methyltransferase [Hyella patelloides]VEP17544.1 Tetracenomycin C synthesis protein homolog [Hyella patelloides LEGE 07179]
MNTKTLIDLGTIQETLLITLWARAEEFKRSDSIISDRHSAEIISAIDYDFTRLNPSNSTQVSCCLRGWLMDNWVKDYLERYPFGVVVELGAGLDTRFERLDNGTVRWFDLDLPDTIALRQQFFTETERRKFITASALDTDWCDLVKEVASGQPCLFITEGVLMYLAEEQVKQLFANLLQHFSGSQLAFDSMSPFLTKREAPLKNMSARFNWGIADIKEIEAWNSSYKLLEVKSYWNAPEQYLRRFSWFNRLFFSLPWFRNSYRLALVNFV